MSSAGILAAFHCLIWTLRKALNESPTVAPAALACIVLLIGEVPNVQRHSPVICFVTEKGSADHEGRDRVQVRRVAIVLVPVIQARADDETGHARDGEPVGRPQVRHAFRNALRMIAHQGIAAHKRHYCLGDRS
jgi:hypothetical protein